MDYKLGKTWTVFGRYTQDHWSQPFPLVPAAFWGDDIYPSVESSWIQPGYQATVTANQNGNIPGSFCAGGVLKCRVTPDVAMDAAPGRGYLIFSHGLGGGGGTAASSSTTPCRSAGSRRPPSSA